MLKNPLRPPLDMQHVLSDGGRIAIVDERKLNGEIRILGLADQRITILPVRNWKSQFWSQIGWAADGKSLFALAQSASSMAILALDSNGNPRVLHEMPSGTVGFPALCRLHQENVHTRRDAV
jgi:hypothetical protein